MRSLSEYLNNVLESKNTDIIKVPSIYRGSPEEEWRFLDTSYVIKDSDIKEDDFEKTKSNGDGVYLYNLKYRIPYDPDKQDLMGWHTEYEGKLAFIPTISQEYGSRKFDVLPIENGGVMVGGFSSFDEAKKVLIKLLQMTEWWKAELLRMV